MCHMYTFKVGLRIVEGQVFMQLKWCGLHDRQSHVTSQHGALLETIHDYNGPPGLVDSDEEDDEDEEDN